MSLCQTTQNDFMCQWLVTYQRENLIQEMCEKEKNCDQDKRSCTGC